MSNKTHKIGDIIAKLRKEKDWTQQEIADKLNVSDKAISKWESNKGTPSIEFLPKLAELFNVTIDYLMTGKEQKEKIVTMTKLELCAKNDDIDLFKELYNSQVMNHNLNFKDKKNMNIFDYIFKYESKKLFTHIFNLEELKSILIEHYNNKKFFENVYYMRLLCNDTTVIRDLIRLEYRNSTLKNFIQNDKGIWYNGNANIVIPRKIISDRIIKYIINGKIDISIYDSLTSNHTENSFYSPAFIFPYIIEFILKQKDWEKGKKLLNKAININNENFEKQIHESYKIFAEIQTPSGYYKGFVQIPNSTFDFLFKEEKYDLIELANQVNKIANDYYNKTFYRPSGKYEYINYIATKYDIEKYKINKNKKLSDTEKQKLLCVHDGIVNLDELIAINDFDFYEQMIKKYPICKYESIFEQLYNKQYSKVIDYVNELPYNNYTYREKSHCIYADNQSTHNKLEVLLETIFGFNINYNNEQNAKYILNFIPKIKKSDYYESKFRIPYSKLIAAKNYLFLNDVLSNDLKFIEKACKTATKTELDKALTQIEPNNFKGIEILLNHGAMLKKSWIEEDGDGYKYTIIEDDKIGTEMLKKKIKDVLK